MLDGALRLRHSLVEALELEVHPTLQRQQMCMEFRWYHRDPFGIGLQGLMQGPVRFDSVPGTTGATLIQGPTQTIDIVIFAIFGLGCREITQEAFFVLTASAPKVRLGSAHTTTDIRRVTSHALGRQFNRPFVGAEAEFKVNELVPYRTVIGIKRQGTQEGLPGAGWLQFTLDSGQSHEIVLPGFPTHLEYTEEMGFSLRIVPKHLFALGQEYKLRGIVGHEAGPHMGNASA